jgi:hypothetical protein
MRVQHARIAAASDIIANWPPIYGKESDRHWEEGEDLSLLEFKAIQYKRRGNAVATDEQLARIAKVPKREFMRRGINQHTLEKICRPEPVRVVNFVKCLRGHEEHESELAVPPADRNLLFFEKETAGQRPPPKFRIDNSELLLRTAPSFPSPPKHRFVGFLYRCP